MADPVNTALLILRITLGVVFIAHGVKHARGRHKTTNWFASMGWRYANFQWMMSTATEIGVGVLLVAGLLTSLAAAGIAGIMFVAYLTVHRKAGFWITARPDEGWEYVFTLTAMALALAMIGAGEWSVDHGIDLADKLDGWVGLLIVAAGLATAVAQVALFFRPPSD
jgi:putative oxidoreductase